MGETREVIRIHEGQVDLKNIQMSIESGTLTPENHTFMKKRNSC